jgi:hypothetical protein
LRDEEGVFGVCEERKKERKKERAKHNAEAPRTQRFAEVSALGISATRTGKISWAS